MLMFGDVIFLKSLDIYFTRFINVFNELPSVCLPLVTGTVHTSPH